ncbi:MAG: tripartite tricarboxylate transporter permease [Candidatus Vecturithrix sp.]|nr:tripartite tricarboxylate transporter permease [Candidatus Vecturithrix sp.]
MESFFQEVSLFWTAFVSTLTLMKLSVVMSATIMGIVVGAIPGLTATMALALLINLTYGMELGVAIAFLLGVYVGAVMGGCNAAIMINIPGTPSAAATALDGFILAKRGEGGIAIGTGVIASFIGMMISITLLIFLTPFLYKIALRFGQWEYFLLSVFGIMICGNLSTGKDPIKGWVVGFLGFFTAMIGLDQIYAYPRFTFGSLQLKAGITLIPALIGVFGISEILIVLQEQVPYQIRGKIGKIVPSRKVILSLIPTAIRSGLIGVGIGAIPGAGEDIGAWVAYDIGKRRSKHGHLYGTGCLEGVAAAETANNAVVGGAMIPLLTLAVPGSPPAAMFLAAIWLHGIRPGPMLPVEQPGFLYVVAAMLFLASISMLIWGLLLARPMAWILKINREILMPIIVPLTVIGAFAGGVRSFDIIVMFVFGMIGYILRQLDYPMAPLVLGIILGPMADISFRQALMQSRGSLVPLLSRPIGLILITAIALIAFSGVRRAAEYSKAQNAHLADSKPDEDTRNQSNTLT